MLVNSDGMAKLTSHSVMITQLTNLILDLIFIGPMKMMLEGAARYFTAKGHSSRLVNVFKDGIFTILNSQL